jgi:hypothetical protein
MPQPSAPPGATQYTGEGPLLTAAQRAMSDIRNRLQTNFSTTWDVKRFAVPAGTQWDAIKDHYAQALGSQWQVDDRYAEEASRDYRAKVWSDGEHAVAIALVSLDEPDGEQVLTVLVPTKKR